MVVKREEAGRKAKIVRLAADKGKKLILVSLAGLIWIQPVALVEPFGITSSTAYAAENKATRLGEENITSGAKLVKYQYTTTRSGKQVKVLADVIEVDLSNPYVQLDVMTGKAGQLTTRQSVEGMAQENGAVAGVNGDFFQTGGQGVAMGAAISQGTLVTSPSKLQGMFTFGVKSDNTPVIDRYDFTGSVLAEDGSTFPLSGINQESYKTEPESAFSHVNNMFIYTSAWKSEERPKASGTTPTEVLVQGGVIQQISHQSAIPGPVPSDGYILRGHGQAADYIVTHMTVGQRVDSTYRLVSQTSGQEVNPSDFKMMIGGHTLLVDQGKGSSFTRPTNSISGGSAVARTAVGYSQDGKKAYIITIEKNNSSSGLTLAELQKFMTSIGVWKGINLDGGGSTTMVTRPLAETAAKLTFTTSNGAAGQRAVANGLGVYTIAPQGALKGLKVSGASTLLIGQTVAYTLKGYDTYYNPVDAAGIQATWKSDNGNIAWTGEGFKGVKAGTSKITAVSGDGKDSMEVTVLGGSDLSSLTPVTTFASLEAGTSVSVPVTAKLKNGNTVNVPDESVKWEFTGMKASVQNGVLSVQSVNNGAKVAYATPKYDGFSGTPIVLSASSEQVWENFENASYPVSFTGLPAEVTGTAAIVQGTGEREKSKVLKLDYDLTGGSGNKFAYAQINGTTGKTIPEGATSMAVDVLGDGSLNWLRAEFADADGKSIYVDLARPLDFTGWKTLTVDLTASAIKHPAKLKRLYIVNLEDGQDERALTGSVSFDNIRFTAPVTGGEPGLPSTTVVMVAGQKSMTIDGKKQNLDAAPLIKDGTTYVPIKYVLDAYGGQAAWNKTAKKITVTSGTTVLELTVGKKEFMLNGTAKQAAVSPIISSNRTLVPLRLVSEQLGITVNWEKKTKTITLQS
ncbi:copper amine oxidase-like protein [Fontibacillus phaseoli]|uniref:Copper amine oxidase-like protein n=1 Tax=Fontibacillus phaseoli TaxID=1416533 RepID=A0A369BC14_9BACL|nr:stalk domain-containing protein [Fontibacillus phaseoli]RCX19092.1 copper amine oxidase-like protein [Fontibacillus phaseoli]